MSFFRKKIFLSFCVFLLILTIPAFAYGIEGAWWKKYWNKGLSAKIDKLHHAPILEVHVPVLFGIEIGDFIPDYGAPRSGGRTHEGQDILSPIGTPVVTPSEAVVTHILDGASAGHSVYTANPGDETFAYLHLDRVNPLLEVGSVLQKGDLLGYVGDTGNAKGGPAHLHFEILQDDSTDPFPRLIRTFSLKQKMEYTERFLQEMSSEEKIAVVGFLVTNFADEFEAAWNAGITVPSDIASLLFTDEEQPAVVSKDLTIGARGDAVASLQQYLINRHLGAAAKALADVGATGYFGSLTRDAVVELQLAEGIQPANGYYGLSTQHVVQGENDDEVVVPVLKEPEAPAKTSYDLSGMPQVNLDLGDKNQNVVWLQKYLLFKNTGLAAQELLQYGPTGYFGAVTRAALAEYQQKHDISPAVGFYGPLTRAHIQGLD